MSTSSNTQALNDTFARLRSLALKVFGEQLIGATANQQRAHNMLEFAFMDQPDEQAQIALLKAMTEGITVAHAAISAFNQATSKAIHVLETVTGETTKSPVNEPNP